MDGAIFVEKHKGPATQMSASVPTKIEAKRRLQMRIKGKDVLIFIAGSAVGAVVSAIVTRKMVDETYKKAADDEIFKIWESCKEKSKKDQERVKDLEEKITQQNVTIRTLADQVRKTGGVPVSDDESEADDDAESDPRPTVSGSEKSPREAKREEYVRYARSYDRAEAEFPMEEDLVVEEMIENGAPRVISEEDFANTCLDYGKEDLRFFMYDGKIITEDGEYLDNYASVIGEDWKLHGKHAGDEVYVRNDYLQADYNVIFTAGSGENNMDVSDIW